MRSRVGRRVLGDSRNLPKCEAGAHIYTLQKAEGRTITQPVFFQLAIDLLPGDDFVRLVFQSIHVENRFCFADGGFAGLPKSACKGLPVLFNFRGKLQFASRGREGM